MNRRKFLKLSTGGILSASSFQGAAAGASDDHRIFDELLARYLVQSRDGIVLVDYARWKASVAGRSNLASFLTALAAQRPSTMSRNERFAFWANLYNAATLKIVIDNYPVRSIRDIKSDTSLFDLKGYIGPWRTKIATIENRPVSLDDIEHGIMRPTFKDPRVHYSVNCASIGCPNLPARSWRAETLDRDLDAAARTFVNHPRGAWVGSDGQLRLSSIYKWFKDDFGGTDAGVLAHLKKYAGPDLLAKLPARAQAFGDDYDWSLNQAGRRG